MANITTRVMNAEQLELPENSCDAAISRLGLMLIGRKHQALVELRRVLKPGGRLAAMRRTEIARPISSKLSTHPWQQFGALHQYLGILGGEIVATSSLFVGSATCGIYDIMTRADARQRGIGSAMFAHTLQEARRFSHRTAVLQASVDGIGIYRKAGFILTGEVLVFDIRPLLTLSMRRAVK